MSEFTVYAFDINTNTKLTELPGNGLTFSSRLNDQGSISLSLPLGRKDIKGLVAPLLAYDGRPVKLYVDRGGGIVGAGYIAWTGRYQKSTGVLQISGNELGSYFGQRIILRSYDETVYPSGITPGVLLETLFADAQNPTLGGAGASIGLQVVNQSTGMPTIVPGYPLGQYTRVSQIAKDMSDIMVPGAGRVDVTVRSAWDTSGVPVDTLTVWSPRAGRSATTSGLIIDMDSVIDYTWPTDAKLMGTTITATGSGTGATMPVATATAPGVPVGGLGQSPRLDKVVTIASQSQAQVSLMAGGVAAQYGDPVGAPTVTIPTGGTLPLGSWAMGDDARLYTSGDERFPTGLSQFWRIVQQEITVPDDGLPTVTLTFAKPPVY